MVNKNRQFREVGEQKYRVGYFNNGIFYYDFYLVLKYLEDLGKIHFTDFQIFEVDIPVIQKICIYFLCDEKSCEDIGLNKNKGLLLYGGVGAGKTSLLQLIPLINLGRRPIPLHNVAELSCDYTSHGASALNVINFKRPFILDDIGSDRKVQNYGNATEMTSDIIKKFANQKNELTNLNLVNKYGAGFHQRAQSVRTITPKDIVMHGTTNCDAETLSTRYDERTISRMNQLFNVLSFDEKSIDKRM